MTQNRRSTRFWIACLAGILAAGMLSRTVSTGWVVFDKYLGDALYAAMFYAMLRLVWRSAAVAAPAMAIVTAMELFQLTMIPAHLLQSEHGAVRLLARLLGTEFSWWDLLAYGVGIAVVYWVDESGSASQE